DGEVVVVARAQACQRGELRRRQRRMQAGAELGMVADAIDDGRQSGPVGDTLRGFRRDAVAAAAGFAAGPRRRHVRPQVGGRRAPLPRPALTVIRPRSRKFGLLASCAISKSPMAITPSCSDVALAPTRRWKRSARTASTPSTACAAAMMRLK